MNIDKNIKILLVDDALAIRMVAQKILQKLGYANVTLAENGMKALEKIKTEPYNLVIADWQMPEMTGIDLIIEMRKDDNLKDIPFILVTADDDHDNMVLAIKAGISNMMKKPYQANVLEAKINRVFEFHAELKRRAERKKK
ncbi:MAG: response regulator [Deltaproteobacteria bacterium]|jgi:two-component system, chemotaxis family, chemotaxis protein CheY|nr:response regulator [Deltaproteobacteria bacterium]MBT4527173.1 response regulator [Deltaproteobacteria bacterium]